MVPVFVQLKHAVKCPIQQQLHEDTVEHLLRELCDLFELHLWSPVLETDKWAR